MAMPIMKKLTMMTQRALWIAALIAMLTPGAAVAEPIIIISRHNLEYAGGVCSSPLLNAEGIAECKFAGDGRQLGRKLENEVRSRMATPLSGRRSIPTKPSCL